MPRVITPIEPLEIAVLAVINYQCIWLKFGKSVKFEHKISSELDGVRRAAYTRRKGLTPGNYAVENATKCRTAWPSVSVL